MSPRNVSNEDWYRVAADTLEKYQRESFVEQDKREQEKKAKYLKVNISIQLIFFITNKYYTIIVTLFSMIIFIIVNIFQITIVFTINFLVYDVFKFKRWKLLTLLPFYAIALHVVGHQKPYIKLYVSQLV